MVDRSIAVIGGSIAGCAAAAVLRRDGHAVEVFERSAGPLIGRGAGIVIPQQVFETCLEQGLLATSIPHRRIARLDYFCRSPTHGERWLGSPSLTGAALHWTDLYAALRSHLPDAIFHAGRRIDGLTPAQDRVELTISDGGREAFDFAVFADGYQSLGRSIVDPGSHLEDEDVILIRGLTRPTSDDERLRESATRVLYPGGHGIIYLVSEGGGADGGREMVNWAFYMPLPDQIRGRGVRRSDNASSASEASSILSADDRKALVTALETRLPAYFSGVLERAAETHFLPVQAVTVQKRVLGRSCLVGDAGSIFPPYTASGVLKAVTNALSLAAAFRGETSDAGFLEEWGAAQARVEVQVAQDGERYGRLLVHAVPEVEAFDMTEAEAFVRSLHPGVPFAGPRTDRDLPRGV